MVLSLAEQIQTLLGFSSRLCGVVPCFIKMLAEMSEVTGKKERRNAFL